jgi:DNA-binding YbaB/EbfC family protein|tara:strand:+ start:585 stop:911 length:327 start_codon:yes stop_codon:yes gene_type:complete
MFKDGMDGLMQQAKVMQERMAKMQEELANAEVQGESGAGMVKAVMNGRYDVKKIDIDPSLLTEDKEMLEDLIAAAINDAVRKVEANSKNMMKDITGGMDMPAGFKMPF